MEQNTKPITFNFPPMAIRQYVAAWLEQKKKQKDEKDVLILSDILQLVDIAMQHFKTKPVPAEPGNNK